MLKVRKVLETVSGSGEGRYGYCLFIIGYGIISFIIGSYKLCNNS